MTSVPAAGTPRPLSAEGLLDLPPGTWELRDHAGAWQHIDRAFRDGHGDIQVDTPAMNLAYRPDDPVTVRPTPPHAE